MLNMYTFIWVCIYMYMYIYIYIYASIYMLFIRLLVADFLWGG